MQTVAQCLQSGRARLGEQQDLDVQVLLCHSLNRPRSYLYAWPDATVNEQQLSLYDSLIAARARGEPVAYLIGQREFWSLPLKVTPATLIPRPDTELLVSTALDVCQREVAHVLDLGTGSGAVALAIASERQRWQVLAVDSCPDALAVAQENTRTLGLRNVRCEQSSWYNALGAQCFDLIVSNPPYIDPCDEHLSQGDLRFEPRSALVAKNSGFADIDTIVSDAPRYLCAGGHLLLEHGYQQGQAVRELLQRSGFCNVQSYRDLAGHERISGGRFDVR